MGNREMVKKEAATIKLKYIKFCSLQATLVLWSSTQI